MALCFSFFHSFFVKYFFLENKSKINDTWSLFRVCFTFRVQFEQCEHDAGCWILVEDAGYAETTTFQYIVFSIIIINIYVWIVFYPRPFCFVMAQRKPFVALHVTLMSVLGYLGMQMTMLADDSTAVDEVYWGSEWWWWWWGWWEMALNVDAKNPLNFIWNWIFVFIPMELEWNGMVHSFFKVNNFADP